jgi:phosphoribosylamine--glycine ligase
LKNLFVSGSDMKILIVGGGGREHTIAWKLSASSIVEQIFVAPGNGGIIEPLVRVDIKANDLDGLLKFVKDKDIHFTVVGPEEPLTRGIVDQFEKERLSIFGPTSLAAEIEGSKVFTREFLTRHNIPQPEYAIFDDSGEAFKYIEKSGHFPLVIKADGLAAGKGVTIAIDRSEATAAVQKIMVEKVFGDAGNKVLIEQFLNGKEVSYFVLTDGKDIIPLATAQDYKRVKDENIGPNTGGMGCYSPSAFISKEQENYIIEKIILPTLEGLSSEGRKYKGFLYAGLMITDDGIKVLEYNCRMGDPEAQVIIPRITSDFLPYLKAAADENLLKLEPMKWTDKAAITVVLASRGYPGKPETGYEIKGIDAAGRMKEVLIFHAGTTLKNGKVFNSGGRVLAVTALGKNLADARKRAYEATNIIHFEGIHFRKDISADAI